jgi:hypothetical protein
MKHLKNLSISWQFSGSSQPMVQLVTHLLMIMMGREFVMPVQNFHLV